MKESKNRDEKVWANFQRAVQIIECIKKRQIYKFVKEFHYFIEDNDPKSLEIFKDEFRKDKIQDFIHK